MISAGVDGRLPYMTYPEPWRAPPKQPPAEFLRPAPKPISSARYNGIAPNSNGTRLAPPSSSRQLNKYPTQHLISTPVNLTQHKDEVIDDISTYNAYSRFFAANHLTAFPPYPPLYQPQYAAMMRAASYSQPPLSPLETYSPTTPTASGSATFLSPSYSPPSAIKTNQSFHKEKRTPPLPLAQPHTPPGQVAFKVPSGKEGSLKHRILTRPEEASRVNGPMDYQKPQEPTRKRLTATVSSPPRSPKIKSINNNSAIGSFGVGSLIRLANGELRKIEDMKTEDFVISAEKNSELRLADSTVVKIEEVEASGNARITLSYNQRRTQVDVESSMEHPYYVYGQGWASCNPDKTFKCYGLTVHRLQVGDVLISLTPREPPNPPPRTSTIMTTATTTAMTVRQTPANHNHVKIEQQNQPLNLHTSHPQPSSPDSLASRKRRWSAPEVGEEDEPLARRQK